jgi:hypothetical protein
MTIERPMFPPRADKSALRLVGGIEFRPTETEPSPAQGKRKARGPYKLELRPIEYQDGLPVIDPAGEEDFIFRHIAAHRAAIGHHDPR